MLSLTNNVIAIAITIVVGGVVVNGVIAGGSSALATTVDVSTGATVAADDDNAISTVIPPSSTKDKEAYVGASVAFQGACLGAFTDSAGDSAAAFALLPLHCHRCTVRRLCALRCRHRR